MVFNPKKPGYMCLDLKRTSHDVFCKNAKEQKLSDVIIDNNLNVHSHINKNNVQNSRPKVKCTGDNIMITKGEPKNSNFQLFC